MTPREHIIQTHFPTKKQFDAFLKKIGIQPPKTGGYQAHVEAVAKYSNKELQQLIINNK